MTRYIYTGLIIARKCLIINHNWAYFKLKTTIFAYFDAIYMYKRYKLLVIRIYNSFIMKLLV